LATADRTPTKLQRSRALRKIVYGDRADVISRTQVPIRFRLMHRC
jgi:hypothetical protein